MQETYIDNQTTEPEGSNNVLFSRREHVLYYRGEGMFKRPTSKNIHFQSPS